MRQSTEELVIPTVPFEVIRARLQERWIIRDASHHSVLGKTRSGKSFLARHGILSVCEMDRVLIIDGKGDDPTFRGLGRVVNRFPSKAVRQAQEARSDNPRRRHWYRLVTSEDWARAHDQVAEALTEVMHEGDWVVVTDELRYLTDAKYPGLGLRAEWERIRLRGGYKGVGLVDLSQEPKWLPGSFYTQSAFYWISRIEDEATQKRVAEIGSSRAILNHLPTIKRRWWIYMDDLDDERFWALTTVT